MIRDYLRMKHEEIKMKWAFYKFGNEIIKNKRDIINTVINLVLAFKDTPIDELQDKFITALAEIIHESGEDIEEPDEVSE